MRYLITGGAGFIGVNLADAILARGEPVTVLDDLSRPLSVLNLNWLQARHGNKVSFVRADVREAAAVRMTLAGHDVVFHLAGQVAVTTSVLDPRTDFEINALGTLNVLEAARLADSPPVVLFASTNKVYGRMTNVEIEERPTRYSYRSLVGCSELQPLDFCSPYGCSKGSADQYVRDYARIYGLRTVVFRQSCIYGPRQFGVEDQGWAAHFAISAALKRPITIFGSGKQVRDMLHVDDLIACYFAALDRIDRVSEGIYNIGGGPQNTISIWEEFRPILERVLGRSIAANYADWRPGDQQVYISDIAKAERDLDWRPRISVADGVDCLVRWTLENKATVAALRGRG